MEERYLDTSAGRLAAYLRDALKARDEDPAFDELDTPDNLPYRRAVGE